MESSVGDDGWNNINRSLTATGTRGLRSGLWMGNKKNRATLVRSYSTPITTKADPVHVVNILPSPRGTDNGSKEHAMTKEFLTKKMTKDFLAAESSGSPTSPGVRRTIHV